MPQRDLHVFTCYLEQMKSASTELKAEIQSVIDAIDDLKKKMPALAPSITLPRKNILECTICSKRVIQND